MSNRILYWFRNDLRLQDNEAFWNAVSDADEVIPVYVFDPRRFRVREPGMRKAGIRRAAFLFGMVQNLQASMREKGGNLLIRTGDPEKVVADLANHYNVTEVRASKEITLEETNVEASLSKKLKGINVDISLTWMNTLIHPHDLPFYISRLPEDAEEFAGAVGTLKIRLPVDGLELSNSCPSDEGNVFPDYGQLGFDADELEAFEPGISPPTEAEIAAGLAAGKAGVEDLLNWISVGLVSPRVAYHKTNGSELGDALYRQLIWRDYLQFVALKYGTRLFKSAGLAHEIDRPWRYDKDAFELWREGETSDAGVNSLMKKFNRSGTITLDEMSVVAHYLIEEMGVNWTWGASWIESRSVYYEVALVWGNWNYYAGLGPVKKAG